MTRNFNSDCFVIGLIVIVKATLTFEFFLRYNIVFENTFCSKVPTSHSARKPQSRKAVLYYDQLCYRRVYIMWLALCQQGYETLDFAGQIL